MSQLSRVTTWVLNQILTSSALNGEFNNVLNWINQTDSGTSPLTSPVASALTVSGAFTHPLAYYRRPVLQYNSSTVVNIETGLTGTSGQTGVLFPDGSYRTDSTTGHIQCNLAQVAALTGSVQSGLRTGTVANNTWYAVYAVKSQANTTDIVAVADTTLPIVANFANLNSYFGTNGWVYLGLIRYGDGSGAASAIIKFLQNGNLVKFRSSTTSTNGNICGLMLATSSGATSLGYTYSSGTSGAVIPSNIGNVIWEWEHGATGSGVIYASDQGGNPEHFRTGGSMSGLDYIHHNTITPASDGLTVGNSASTSTKIDIALTGFWDNVLGVGSNPLI